MKPLKQPEVAENEFNACILLCVPFRGMLNEDDIQTFVILSQCSRLKNNALRVETTKAFSMR